MKKIKQLAEKWYKKLSFPKELDQEFFALLENVHDLKECDIKSYLKNDGDDKGKNVIMFLYFCEALSNQYQNKGISENILLESVKNLPVAIMREKEKSGTIGIEKDAWVTFALKFEIFRLGRLEFQISKMYPEGQDGGIGTDENIIDIHIPADGGSVYPNVCDEAIKQADEFFTQFFPEHPYQYYTCFSWLLDENLREFLDENSNIIQFQKRFTILHKREQDSIIHFLFKFGFTDREEIREIESKSEFAKKIKEKALAGGKFYNVLGMFKR